MKKSLLATAVFLAISSSSMADSNPGAYVVNQELAAGQSQQWESTKLYSDVDIRWNVGVLLNSTITGQGDVTLINKTDGNGLGLGLGTNSITANLVHIDVSGQGISGYGKNSITAKNIVIEAGGVALMNPYPEGTNGFIKLNGFDTATIVSQTSQAITNVGNSGVQIIGNEDSKATLKSQQGWAVYQYMGGDIDVSAGEINIEGPGAIYMYYGDLNLTAEKISIKGQVQATDGCESNIALKAENVVVNGLVDAHTITLDGKVSFLKNTKIKNLSGTNAEIEFVNPEASLQINQISAENVKFSATASASEAVGGDATKLIDTNNIVFNENINTEMLMAGGEVIGEVQVILGEGDDGQLVVVSQKEAINEDNLEMTVIGSEVPTLLARVEMNDLRKRMGNLRSAEGTNGVWARYDGGKMSGLGLDYKFNKVQVGIDTIPEVGAPRFGVAFSYTDGKADGLNDSADMKSYSLAGYGVWMGDNGQFVDVMN